MRLRAALAYFAPASALGAPAEGYAILVNKPSTMSQQNMSDAGRRADPALALSQLFLWTKPRLLSRGVKLNPLS